MTGPGAGVSVAAVVFDLDGVLLDSEQVWDDVRQALARDAGRPWPAVAGEDSGNGLRSAAAAGLVVGAVPNQHYPPSADALALAAATVPSLDQLTVDLITSVAGRRAGG